MKRTTVFNVSSVSALRQCSDKGSLYRVIEPFVVLGGNNQQFWIEQDQIIIMIFKETSIDDHSAVIILSNGLLGSRHMSNHSISAWLEQVS